MPTMREVLGSDEHPYGSVWRINDPDASSRHGAIVMKVTVGAERHVMAILEPARSPGAALRGDSWGMCDIPVEPVTMELDQRPRYAPNAEMRQWPIRRHPTMDRVWLDESASFHPPQDWMPEVALEPAFTRPAQPSNIGQQVTLESIQRLSARVADRWRIVPSRPEGGG